MPLYEYRCTDCDSTFEQRRTFAEADEVVACPSGHLNVKRLLSVVARTSGLPEMGGGGGVGCCGGGCGCG
ncbi:MAG TPA: zinc ribbon domain-containing protein [Acidimicrobiales bacterium]|nr:zinc ribbon domain-containing protein [Acidimicrobiales bacterium]